MKTLKRNSLVSIDARCDQAIDHVLAAVEALLANPLRYAIEEVEGCIETIHARASFHPQLKHLRSLHQLLRAWEGKTRNAPSSAEDSDDANDNQNELPPEDEALELCVDARIAQLQDKQPAYKVKLRHAWDVAKTSQDVRLKRRVLGLYIPALDLCGPPEAARWAREIRGSLPSVSQRPIEDPIRQVLWNCLEKERAYDFNG